MSTPSWEEAIAEAMATAPSGEIVLHTLEINHPSLPSPIRVVRDFSDHELRPGSGERVLFQGLMFDFSLPEASINSNANELEISLDNVTGELARSMEVAASSFSPVELTYREYLASDPDTVQYSLTGLTITRAPASLTRMVMTASFANLNARSFPGIVYDNERFPGL